MKTLINTTLLFAVTLLAATALAANIDETRGVASDATITVSNVAGEIDVTTWDRAEMRLTGSLGNNQELEITENALGLVIEVSHIRDSNNYDESFLELVIPEGASIVAEGVSADISVAGSEGASVTAESVSGDVTVTARPERLELSTVSGDIDFEGSASRSSIESVSGDIDLEGLSGEITISSVSGDVELTAGSISEGSFDTVSGSIELDVSVENGGKLTVECMNGDVDLWLPPSQTGSFSAQTFSGDINTDFGEVKHEKYGPGSHFKYVAGDSGTIIRVESFSGDIHIGHK